MDDDAPLINTVGTVLDPILSLRCSLRIEPGEEKAVYFVTGYGGSKKDVLLLSEKYSKDYAYKAVIIGLVMNLLFTFFMQIALLYIPSSTDISNESMKKLFNLNLRVSLSSSLLYFLSNYLDIYLFNKLKEKYPNKLWLRNNVSTIISNCLENYLFVTLSFIGIYDINTIISIATTTSIIEIFLAILDTPFLYLSKKNNT